MYHLSRGMNNKIAAETWLKTGDFPNVSIEYNNKIYKPNFSMKGGSKKRKGPMKQLKDKETMRREMELAEAAIQSLLNELKKEEEKMEKIKKRK